MILNLLWMIVVLSRHAENKERSEMPVRVLVEWQNSEQWSFQKGALSPFG